MIMLSAAARVVAPGLGAQFDRDSRAFHAAMDDGRQAAIAAAGRLRATLRQLSNAFASADMGRNTTFAIIDTITSEAILDRFTDYAGSVQVMATDTLLGSGQWRRNPVGDRQFDPGGYQRRLSGRA